MSKLLMLKGLPASGKSTYAKKLASDGWVRVNKDDLRSMLHAGKWSPNNEKQVLQIRDQIISDSLFSGKSVVVDDTNLSPNHKTRLQELAVKYGATFETKYFDVSPEECIKRDLGRPTSVGAKVIMSMYNQFVKEKVESPAWDHTLPTAILCDIDGTLAHIADKPGKRIPYDWGRVGEDTLDKAVWSILDRMGHCVIILLSGRDGVCQRQTKEWLIENDVPYDKLLMRAENDTRKDCIVKKEIYEQYIKGKYNVSFVLDDRNQVVDMWRNELGLKCLQVAEGDF
jgi:predicted kinase